eukprot:3263752-Rhodomonas_salina.1
MGTPRNAPCMPLSAPTTTSREQRVLFGALTCSTSKVKRQKRSLRAATRQAVWPAHSTAWASAGAADPRYISANTCPADGRVKNSAVNWNTQGWGAGVSRWRSVQWCGERERKGQGKKVEQAREGGRE